MPAGLGGGDGVARVAKDHDLHQPELSLKQDVLRAVNRHFSYGDIIPSDRFRAEDLMIRKYCIQGSIALDSAYHLKDDETDESGTTAADLLDVLSESIDSSYDSEDNDPSPSRI